MRGAIAFLCLFALSCRGTVSGTQDGSPDVTEEPSPADGDGGASDDAGPLPDDGGITPDDAGAAADDGAVVPDGGDASGDDGGPAGEIIPMERRVIWEGHVGIPGGIPARATCCANLRASDFGDGTADATAAIQGALDNCAPEQAVCLSAGTFRFTATVFIRERTTLRGAGMGQTVLSYQGPAGGRSAIAFTNWPDFDSAAHLAVTGGAVKGSTRVTVADASGAAAGSVMLIDQLNDGDFVDPDGVEGKCTYCGRANGDRTLGQLVEVTSVSGDQVSFNVPLYWSYDSARAPEATFVPARRMLRWAGLEDLTLTQPQVSVTYLVELQGAQYCWLKDVEVQNVDWRAVWVLSSLQNEIRRSYFHHSINGYGRSHGYGVLLDMFSSANLVEDNMFYSLDGGFMMTAGGAAGNVLSYNYMHEARFDDPWWATASPCLNHAPHPMMNLWEGNVGYQLSADFIHGSSSHNTVFRSVSRGFQNETITSNNNAVELATKNYYYNVVGCVLGTEGRSNRYEALPGQAYDNTEIVIFALGIMHGVDDTRVAQTLLRHGNHDFVTRQTAWDPAIPARALPASLYLPGKPAWFGDVPFPPIGPDVTGLIHKIPAQLRFESLP
ncbi:MAG: hypothetical protein GYA21_15615 [Myxococcales bacterium]|nr:hypothetical protein [Myxococcales bacterium]